MQEKQQVITHLNSSFYIKGWNKAKEDYPDPPKKRVLIKDEVVNNIGGTDLQLEWFISGYQDYCLNKYEKCKKTE